MRIGTVPFLVLGLIAASSRTSIADADVSVAGRNASDRDSYNLLLLAPRRPVFIRLHVQVDGASLKSMRRLHAEQLLARYDDNGDNVLERDEARKIPPLVAKSDRPGLLSLAESWASADRDPADDRVTLDELADWVDRALGSSFSLAARSARSTQNVGLFALLDVDGDGRLSRDELTRAGSTLARLDLDEDETFTIDEISEMPRQAGLRPDADAGGSGSEQPFLLLADDDSISAAAQQILRRYGAAGDGGFVSCERLAPGDPAAKAMDENGDGRLSPAELVVLLKRFPPQIELLAGLLQNQPGRSRLQVLVDRLNSAGPGARTAASDKAMLATEGVAIEWRVQTRRGGKSDNRNFYKIKFLQVDADKNKYISAAEFAALGIPDATFAQVDRDGDEMLTQDELIAFIDQDSSASQSRVVMTVSHDSKSIFEVLDATLDRRLTMRELRSAAEHITRLDRDGDGAISAIELAGAFRASLESGQVLVFRSDDPSRGGAATTPVVNRARSGPDWFQKMDRNRDGDVSRREFPGPPKAFNRLDDDGDGLISADEAARGS